MTIPSDTFCILPWISIATNNAGVIRLCGESCLLRRINGPSTAGYSIAESSIADVWNGPEYQEARAKMLRGEWPIGCAKCKDAEAAGKQSYRQLKNAKHYTVNEYSTTAGLNDIRLFDFRLGNLCNIKCRMCSPAHSTRWTAAEYTLVNKGFLESVGLCDWVDDPKTIENIYSIIDGIEEIKILGGEPTIIGGQHTKLLDTLIASGQSKNIRLKYNINLVVLPQDLLLKWRHFKNVQVLCSVDAIGPLNNYIRYPSKWETCLANFEALHSLDHTISKCEAIVYCTVEMYNILQLDKLIEWSQSYDRQVIVHFNILTYPPELDITTLPPELKKIAEQRLDKYHDVPGVKSVLAHLAAKDTSDLMPTFIETSLALDASRGQSLYDVIPEFKEFNFTKK